jgi:DNA polymerase I-like protein with 3'-5' exonuclease and polymerase domains
MEIRNMSGQLGFFQKLEDVPDSDIKDVAYGALDQDWSPPAGFPRGFEDADIISIDLETSDPNLMTRGPGWVRNDGFICGIAIAYGDFCGYFPIRHEGGGNMPEKSVMAFVKKICETDVPKVMHNAQYDLGWLRWAGIKVNGTVYDTMVAAAMINENRRWYNLNSLTIDYLGEGKSEKTLRAAAMDYGFDPKAEMWRLPSRFVGRYAEQDADITLRLWNRLKPEIVKEEVSSIFELETELTPLIQDMRWQGVKVDLEGAQKARDFLTGEEKKLHHKIEQAVGFQVEPWAASSLAKAFDKLDIPYPRTAKEAPSFTKQFLSQSEHEISANVLRLREFNKANTTFIENIFKFSHKGRIHAEFHPLRSDDGGTVTGRFSSSNPNLQQIPARDPLIKKAIRGLFVPDEGSKWGSFDYASQEPRWLAHYSGSLSGAVRHPKIDEVISQYQEDDADFHQMVADMAGISRKDAKTVNLGIMYGMGIMKLAGVLDIEKEEAKDLLAEYNTSVPFVKGLADAVSKRAEEYGSIRTVLGRKCRFDMWEPRRYGLHRALPFEEARQQHGSRESLKRAFTYKALNRLIQGSSADQMKRAMVECYKEGFVPLLTVHDELCFNVDSESQANKIKEIMETCTPALVPFKIDLALGDNWGEIE